MRTRQDACSAYVRALERRAPRVLRALRRELGLSRSDAAEALAVTAALVPGGLSRHMRRRPHQPQAAVDVVRKYGRPRDLDAPELGISGRAERDRLSPRLGGLLGDAGPRAARWIAERTTLDEEAAGRTLAVLAPIALGALAVALDGREISDWLATHPDHALTHPERLLEANGEPAAIYRRMRRRGDPWPSRVLGLGG